MIYRVKNLFKSIFSIRPYKFFYQRRIRGWDDSETWNLDQQLAAWLAPRLIRFRELNNGYPNPLSEEEWDQMLDEMCWGAEWYSKNAFALPNKNEIEQWKKDMERATKGLCLITENVRGLWW